MKKRLSMLAAVLALACGSFLVQAQNPATSDGAGNILPIVIGIAAAVLVVLIILVVVGKIKKNKK